MIDLDAEASKDYTPCFEPHKKQLEIMKAKGFRPKVIFDIGACVLHWTKWARKVFPEAEYYMFDAWDALGPFYEARGEKYHLGVLGSEDHKEIPFYQNAEAPWGNSIYKENSKTFGDEHMIQKVMRTLDSVVQEKGWPRPDLVKIDVQGAEMDIIKGALETFRDAKYLIVEMQHVDYNKGAPKFDVVGSWLEGQGWECIAWRFARGGSLDVDGDYLFRRVSKHLLA